MTFPPASPGTISPASSARAPRSASRRPVTSPQGIPRALSFSSSRSSQRSYYAICCLQGNGYRNVVNISGSYLGISLYEYYNDKSQGRAPIMDAYNFD